jgi:hypothetical protein
MPTPLTSHKVARNTLVRRMPGLKRNLLLWPADLSADSMQAWRQLILTEVLVWRRLETKPEYSNAKNKTVEVGADKTYILHVVSVARIEIAGLSPFL